MYKQTLADTIKQHRENKGISQEKLAAKADISPRNYRRIEAGEHHPDLMTIFKLCLALDVHYSDLLERTFTDYKSEASQPQE